MIKKQENIEKGNSLAFVVFGVIITILSLFAVPIGWYIGVLIIQYTIGIFITIPISIIYLSLIFSYIVAGGITYAISKRLIKVTIKDWKDLAKKMVTISLVTGIMTLIISGYIASLFIGELMGNTSQTVKCPGFDDCNSRWAENLSECPTPTENDNSFNSLNPFSSEYNCSKIYQCNDGGCAVANLSGNCQLINFCALLRSYFIYFGPHNPITLFLGAFIAWRFLKW